MVAADRSGLTAHLPVRESDCATVRFIFATRRPMAIEHPLQNRVAPTGEIVAIPERGLLMGNRGGRIHQRGKVLGPRRWASKQWIACALTFKGRKRTVMSAGSYTELFFLDEATALAAGHRPCFECRHGDALRFAECWQRAEGLEKRPRAQSIDKRLHGERLTPDGGKATTSLGLDTVPDGAMVLWDGQAQLVFRGYLLTWTPAGYERMRQQPAGLDVDVLTPPSTLAALAVGYRPMLHPSATTLIAGSALAG